jgi:hypothetical protein
MALAGHVSKSMLARYSHIRSAAKQAAIDAIEAVRLDAETPDFEGDSPQKSPQSAVEITRHRFAIAEEPLN